MFENFINGLFEITNEIQLGLLIGVILYMIYLVIGCCLILNSMDSKFTHKLIRPSSRLGLMSRRYYLQTMIRINPGRSVVIEWDDSTITNPRFLSSRLVRLIQIFGLKGSALYPLASSRMYYSASADVPSLPQFYKAWISMLNKSSLYMYSAGILRYFYYKLHEMEFVPIPGESMQFTTQITTNKIFGKLPRKYFIYFKKGRSRDRRIKKYSRDNDELFNWRISEIDFYNAVIVLLPITSDSEDCNYGVIIDFSEIEKIYKPSETPINLNLDEHHMLGIEVDKNTKWVFSAVLVLDI